MIKENHSYYFKQMKKVFFSILLASLFLANCSKEDLEYSCDPKVNQWVVDNKLKYANISRPEFVQFNMREQIALYRSFTGKQKMKLWNEKINYLLTTQNLPDAEKESLLKLFKFAQPSHFDDAQGRVEFNTFASQWEKDVRSQFGWDDRKIFLYTHTLMKIDEFNEKVAQMAASAKTKSGSKLKSAAAETGDCECYYSIYCMTSSCVDGNCTQVSGCGIFGNSNCTGSCD